MKLYSFVMMGFMMSAVESRAIVNYNMEHINQVTEIALSRAEIASRYDGRIACGMQSGKESFKVGLTVYALTINYYRVLYLRT